LRSTKREVRQLRSISRTVDCRSEFLIPQWIVTE
jgi:hypothetical protein